MGVTARITRALDRSGAFDAVLRLRGRLGSHALPVLCYHRVANCDADYPFDADVIDATPEEFDRHLTWLRRHYTVIGVDELLAELSHQRTPRGAALVTFDDGYRDNFTSALPVLTSHGVSATFFLASSYLTERRIYWWDRISYLLARTRLSRAVLRYPSPIVLELAAQPRLVRRLLLTMTKTIYQLDLDRFLTELGEALEVPWDRGIERQFADELVMSWDQVREMKRAGMQFGSHTRTHRILSTLPWNELRQELTASKREIEAELGIPIRAISYPVGMSIRVLTPVVNAVRAAGYEIGFTNLSGVNHTAALDRFDIARVSLDRDVDVCSLRSMLAFPPLCTVIRPWSSN